MPDSTTTLWCETCQSDPSTGCKHPVSFAECTYDGFIKGVLCLGQGGTDTNDTTNLVDAAENVLIAWGMKWDMEGVLQRLQDALPSDSPCKSPRILPTDAAKTPLILTESENLGKWKTVEKDWTEFLDRKLAVDKIIEQTDYPGEAAERIAAYLGCSFAKALKLVAVWEKHNER